RWTSHNTGSSPAATRPMGVRCMTLRSLPVRAREWFAWYRTLLHSTAAQKETKCLGAPAVPPDGATSDHSQGRVYALIRRIPGLMGNRTTQGDLLIVTTAGAAVLTGYAALFADITVTVIVFVGIVSLVFLALTAAAVWCRYRTAPHQDPLPAPGIPAADIPPTPSGKMTSPGDSDIPIPEERTAGTLDEYWVEPPYVFVKIIRKGNLGFTYTVVEPSISTREKVVLRETYAHMRKIIIYDDPDHPPTRQLSQDFISQIIRVFYPDIVDDRLSVLSYYLRRDLSGFGTLEPLMQDPALEDISCNGGDLPVFVFHRNYGSLPTSIRFREEELNQVVLRLAQKANKQISLSNPMVDATLPGGSRVQVTYSNVVS